jgi:ketosteroid isomerase-like protein
MDKERKRNIEIVKIFNTLIENKDIPGFIDLFAEDGIQYNYFQCNLMPSEINGKKSLTAFWTPIPDRFLEMKFPIEAIFPMLDPSLVVVKFRGFAKLKDNKGDYNNEYLAIFRFNSEGEIKEYHEYSNPVVAAKSFNMLNKIL